MFRSEVARPSGLFGSHQPFAQSIDELLVGLRQVGKKAVDRFDDHAPLRQACDRAERIQARLELDRHANAQLRVVCDLLSFFRACRWATGASAISDALFW